MSLLRRRSMFHGVSLVPIPDPDLHYWPFSGNTDDIVGGNDAINNGAVLTTDKGGNPDEAYLFNGTGDYMSVTSAANIGTVHTITSRVKLSKVVSMFPRYNNNTNRFYLIQIDLINYRANSVDVSFVPDEDLVLNEYYDFAIVRNGLSVKLYINGVQSGGEQILASSGDFFFNQLTPNATWFFGGVMDNMRIYSYALTDDQIYAISKEL